MTIKMPLEGPPKLPALPRHAPPLHRDDMGQQHKYRASDALSPKPYQPETKLLLGRLLPFKPCLGPSTCTTLACSPHPTGKTLNPSAPLGQAAATEAMLGSQHWMALSQHIQTVHAPLPQAPQPLATGTLNPSAKAQP
jgi:hypothetical protein